MKRSTPALSRDTDVRNGDLDVRASAERTFQRAGNPVATKADLFEHVVRGTQCDIGESVVRTRIHDLEPAETAPEVNAAINVSDKQLGNQCGLDDIGHELMVSAASGTHALVDPPVHSCCALSRLHTWDRRMDHFDVVVKVNCSELPSELGRVGPRVTTSPG